MMKPKRKHSKPMLFKSIGTQNALDNPSNVTADSDLHKEDSWVIVKKQRVTILIPRLPGMEQSIELDLEKGQLLGNMPNSLTNNTSQLPDEKPPEKCHSERNYVSISLIPETNMRSPRKVYRPPDNVRSMRKPRKLNSRKPIYEDQVSGSKFHKTPESYKPFKPLDIKMRTSNLERKITRAGGLGKWLSSLGLEQFVRIFRGKNVNKFELANLSMKKLKDMGAHAVGPRRKLIHAIECFCQPYNMP